MIGTQSRRAEIAALLARREREGLTYAELAEIAGIAKTTLSWWSWRLRKERAEEPGFVEVAVAPEPGAPASRAAITLRCNGVAIEVEPGFDAATLQQALDVARASGC